MGQEINEQPNDLSLPPPRPRVSYLCDTTRIVRTGLRACALSGDSPYQKDAVTGLGEAASCKWDARARSFLENFKNPVFLIKLLTANDLACY